MCKRILTILTAAVLLFTLISCGGSETTGDTDLKALGETLLNDAAFTDSLALIDDDTVSLLYGIEGAAEQYVYIGSGATPEEIALFSFTTEADAEAGFALAQMLIADKKQEFSDYNAWEMPKIDDAVVKQYGNVVVLCVSADGRAETIIEETLGK